MSKDLAPLASTPMPAPARDEPAMRPATPSKKVKVRRIPRKIVEVTEILLRGDANNLTQASKIAGVSREYISRTLSARADCVEYMRTRAARALGVAVPVAAARMAQLLHAESEHVSYRASEHVLAVAGIKPAADNVSVNIGIELKAGYVIDLSEPGQSAKIVSGTLIDAKPAE